MNKQITKLLSLILVCSAALKADADTNLTFVSIGGQRNVAERNMLTQRISMRDKKGMGGTLQALPFLKQSSDKQKLAELFSPVGKKTTTIGTTSSTADVKTDPSDGADVYGSISFAPEHREFGVHLAWQQRLDVLLEGLFFEVDAPIVNVRHELNTTYVGNAITTDLLKNAFEGKGPLGDDTLKSFKSYSGNLSKTGVADVAVRLGYNFLENEDYRLAVNFALVAPTGGKPTSEFIFAPQLGGNNAWQVGAGVTLSGKLYDNGDHELRGIAELNYRYSLANTQERTLGLKGLKGAQFATLYDSTNSAVPEVSISYQAANALTTDLKVTGGSAVNLLAGLGYDYKAFSLDASYELNASEAEKAELASTSDFKDAANKRFGRNANNRVGGVAGTEANAGTPTWTAATVQLTKANLDFAPAINPSKLTHKLAAAVGYTFSHDQEYPVALGLGGSYTFGSNRSAFQGWGVFGKLGVSF